jgi:hypothetical protein
VRSIAPAAHVSILSKERSAFAADDMKHCTAETTMGGESRYTGSITYLEMVRDVSKLRAPGPSKRNN